MTESKILESCSKGRAGDGIMSSVAVAHDHTRALAGIIAPDLSAKVKLERLYRALNAAFPEIGSFTRRRVRALFFGEARRIDHDEMQALEALRAVEEARREHRAFVADTNRMAAILAAEGAPLDGRQIEIIRRAHGGMDRAGTHGAAR